MLLQRAAAAAMSCVESLLADMEQLLADSSSDMVIVCQGQEVRCHRLILSARSDNRIECY